MSDQTNPDDQRLSKHARKNQAMWEASGDSEDLIETQPSESATSTYRDAHETAWSRRWPAENIWKLRKE